MPKTQVEFDEASFDEAFQEIDIFSEEGLKVLCELPSPWVAEAVAQSKPLWDQMSKEFIDDLMREGQALGLIEDTPPSNNN